MRLVFAGTPAFAAASLEALAVAGHDIALVLTQPDRPAGRGMAPAASAVKQAAARRGLPVYQPERLKDPATHAPIRAAAADLMVVAAYGLILPQAVLDIPRLGAINVHASLLPRWRGAAPIQRAILAGDARTGISIMRMEAGLDTGPVLLAEAIDIGPGETAGSLHDRLAALGAALVVRAVDALGRGAVEAIAQPAEGETYAAKVEKREARIDWTLAAADLARRVCAFNPFPGATARVRGQEIKLWRAEPVDACGRPGEVLSADAGGVVVACGEGALRLAELQRAGGRHLPPGDFLRGFALAPGDRFDPPQED